MTQEPWHSHYTGNVVSNRFSSSSILPAKLMIQVAMSTKLDWDVPLPEKIRYNFQKWYSELKYWNKTRIDRRVVYGCDANWSLHFFKNRSNIAYATAVFLYCAGKRKVYFQLLGIKSGLALKSITVPRLELLACVLGVKMTTFIL